MLVLHGIASKIIKPRFETHGSAQEWGALQETTAAVQSSLKGFCDFTFQPPSGSDTALGLPFQHITPFWKDCPFSCASPSCPRHCRAVLSADGHRTPAQELLTLPLSYKYFNKCLVKRKEVESFHWKLLQWSIKALQNTHCSWVEQMPEFTHCCSHCKLPPVFRECFASRNCHGLGRSIPGSSSASSQTVSGWWLHLFLSAWCNSLTVA